MYSKQWSAPPFSKVYMVLFIIANHGFESPSYLSNWWKRESMRITRGLPTMAIIVVSRRGPQFRENICCLICKRKWRISRHDGKVNVELPCTCLLKCCCQRTVAYMTGRLVSELHKFMRLIYFKRPLAERFRYEPNNDSWMVKGGGSCTYTRSVTFISTKQRFLDYRQFKITREMRYLLINNFHFNTYYLIYWRLRVRIYIHVTLAYWEKGKARLWIFLIDYWKLILNVSDHWVKISVEETWKVDQYLLVWKLKMMFICCPMNVGQMTADFSREL